MASHPVLFPGVNLQLYWDQSPRIYKSDSNLASETRGILSGLVLSLRRQVSSYPERATQKLIPGFLLVTKSFSVPRRKSCEMLEGSFLPTLVGHALVSGTGKVSGRLCYSFVLFSSHSGP